MKAEERKETREEGGGGANKDYSIYQLQPRRRLSFLVSVWDEGV